VISHYSIPGGVTQNTFNRKENEMKAVVGIVGLLSATIGLVVFFGLLFSLPVMWLWNVALVPAIPGLAEIGWLQAWGIMILSGFLFKNTSVSNKSE
jgi:hypothetical protein